VVERIEVRPVWPVRLRGETFAPPARRDGDVRVRLIHAGAAPVVLRAAQPADDRVALSATADDAAAARAGLARARFWTAVDDDLAEFHARFADDPLIGPSVRAEPWRRPFRRATAFEGLAWAVCEQLIDDERARDIKREILRRFGRRDPGSGLVDVPGAEQVAELRPAELEQCGLAPSRAVSLIRAAREVASGRVDLDTDDPGERVAGWRRLRAIPGIGPWTLSMLALHGQGVHDALPAGDFAYRNLLGAARSGLPQGMASEDEVTAFLTPYAGWRGVAGWHLLMLGPARVRAALGLGPMRDRGREGRHRTR
jgi:3-methyladenine DNA glycosylase/8-oxoguanine DNA glycosylase